LIRIQELSNHVSVLGPVRLRDQPVYHLRLARNISLPSAIPTNDADLARDAPDESIAEDRINRDEDLLVVRERIVDANGNEECLTGRQPG